MYLRTIKRKNKDGSVVEYVQLAHNVRHPEKGYPKAEVIHSFGRREQLDIDGLKRLVASIGRFVESDDPHDDPGARSCAAPMKFIRSQPVGGVYLLRALWDQLQIGGCLQHALKRHAFSISIERALFALVAHGALGRFSAGLPMAQLAPGDVVAGQDLSLEEQHFNQAVDLLRDHGDAIQQEVFRSAARLLNLSHDLVWIDIIPFRLGSNTPGPATLEDNGQSGCHRDTLAAGAIGMAVSRRGIPLQCWLLPATRIDEDFIASVKKDLAAWNPGRVAWVMDRQVTGDENRDVLQRAGGITITGGKLQGSQLGEEALTRKGRFKMLSPELQIKATIVGDGAASRPYVVAYHPGQAVLDRNAREQILHRLRCELHRRNKEKKKDSLPRDWLHPSTQRYVKLLRSGKPKIDITRVRQEERHDGKYLLISSDARLTAEEVAWGHKQLLEIAQVCGALKHSLILPPLDHAHDEYSRSRTLLFWLALLLTRIAEVRTGMTWTTLCREMQRLQLGEFDDRRARILQYTELTEDQKKILTQDRCSPPGWRNQLLKLTDS